MILSKKFIDYYWKFVFGSSKIYKFEDRVILATCLFVSIFGLLTTVANYYLGLDKNMVYLTFFIFILFGIYYIFARFWRLNIGLYFLVTITTLALLNFAWYFNYGSRGPVLNVFIVLCAFYIFVWDKIRSIIFSALLFINLFVLFIVELNDPSIVGSYIDESSRVIDIYFGLLTAMLLIMAFSLTVKRYYLKEHLQARKADQLKSAFLANMSHEIRTPLNAIIGFSSIISDEDFDQSQKDKYKGIIESNSDYLLNLIEDIIDLSKIEVDELEFNMKSFDLTVMFELLEKSFTNSLSIVKKELVIRSEIGISDSIIKSDAIRLQQVLRNLINNAIKFTDGGEIVFGCEMLDNKLTFYVKDTGIGIRPENLENIFNRFVKIEESSNNISRGTGIGLFLSRQLVEKLGGRIWVESEYGTGTCFYFTINAIQATESNFSSNPK